MIIDKLKYLNSLRIVLASGSPRRKQLLTQIGLKFEVIPSTFPEDLDKSKFTPSEYVIENAKLKALQVFESQQSTDSKDGKTEKSNVGVPDLVIGSDTVVVFNDKILEKPANHELARKMLSDLSGSTHFVASGVALINKDKEITTFVQKTKVKFAKLSPEMIDSYLDTKEYSDKAGGYGMQAIAGQFVTGIDGCYFNVVGFPIQLFCDELRKFMKLDTVKVKPAVVTEEKSCESKKCDAEPPKKKRKISK